MSDEAQAPVAAAAIPLPADAPAEMSVSEAARLLSQARRPKEEAPPAESAHVATADEPELADEANAAPHDEAPSEETEATEPEETLPLIDPPRSWTKAEKERFQTLPRETQEYLHTREQEREREVRRSQNEAADIRKAAEAAQKAAEEARQKYEAQLPSVMQALQDAQNGAFADIRTVDDVTKLANEDPFRYLQWQAHQTKLQAVNAEMERANREQQTKAQSVWAEHVQKENTLAAEYIPELADKVKGPALTQRVATELLPELGFKDSELNELAAGKQKLSIYDHRVQRLLADALKLRDIQSAPKAVATKPLPPVQRPGTAQTRSPSAVQQIQVLQKQLTSATGDKAARIAAQLLKLQRAAASR